MARKKRGRGRPTLIPQTEKALVSIIRKKGEIQDSLEVLANKTGRSRSVVAAALRSLEEKGMIAVVSTRPKRYVYVGDGAHEVVVSTGKGRALRRRIIEITADTELVIRVRPSSGAAS